ncbi:MAG: hypothetical protein P857_870 [Candidatus Xenolissoclinum pacificiensis L6]|uniref:Lipoprotein n=1 Tax=Candidatus Xenolissoclinum pacificiensis L6 TaxID=1401685 RepID=W2V2Q6_9RICK|nr:MAG: hypothetical protein P857_870 [Candidatus Xenolissoclinum pacificiensis L6]
MQSCRRTVLALVVIAVCCTSCSMTDPEDLTLKSPCANVGDLSYGYNK